MTHVSHCKWYLILFWKTMGRVRWVPCGVRDVSGSLVCCSWESSRRLIGAVTSVTPLFLFSLSLPQFIPRGALTQPSALRTRRMQVAGLWSSMWRLPVVSKVRMVFFGARVVRKACPEILRAVPHRGPDAKPTEVNRESSLSLQWLLDQAQERFNRGW